ncbi:MAG: acyl-CoA dehydrogenase [Deltaproteobacteria bacterium CG12_big_fil_rev_8_21_14_0_65_43_10]|nr:MAG: acyl-CoA dehydrogenase [Deltaproteobacteria bacterium CG12_big_fil_rev_8_21_14_0_65_43_10]
MDFDFSEDQVMIRDSARKFLEKECPKDKIRELKEDEKGYDPELWSRMAEMGWMGLILPEEYEGTGMNFFDLTILMEEMGRNILPAPFFDTVALCSLPILEYGTSEQKKRFLPKIACGEEIWTLALTEPSASYEPSGVELRATSLQEDYVLEGTKLFVPYANVADRLLVVARTSQEGITVLIVDAGSQGIKTEVIPTTAHDKQCEIVFDKVMVPKDNVLGEVGKGWEIVEFLLQRVSVLKCAEMLGGAQFVLEMANSYAKERVQFDKPVGSFQAIQHKLAEVFINVEGLRHLVYEAAWNISTGSPSRLLTSMVKAKANEVYQQTCIQGVKVHGAIGFTEELDLSLYFLRTKASEFMLGDTGFHRERIAVELEDYQPLFVSV